MSAAELRAVCVRAPPHVCTLVCVTGFMFTHIMVSIVNLTSLELPRRQTSKLASEGPSRLG